MRRYLYIVFSRLGFYPWLFFPYTRLRSKKRGVPVTRHTELVIEGYQRSGNNFAVIAFQLAQQEPVNIAHHLHAPAQIIRAAQRGIPTMLLIRHPIDVACSQVIRSPHIGIERSLKNYILFYEKIFKYQNAYVVALFDDIISDLSTLITRINHRFSTIFELFDPSKENISWVFSHIDWLNAEREKGVAASLSRPSIEKQLRKRELLYDFKTDKIRDIVNHAESLFIKYCQLSRKQNDL